MAHTTCHDVGSWVESTIQQQVEQCIEQDCNWWCACCNKWLCALAWVVVNVVSWVVQTVCEVVLDIVDMTVNIVCGMWDLSVGIFTGDWSRALAGLLEIVGGPLAFTLQILSIATLGTLVGTFVGSANAWKLRNYARGLLQEKYGTKDPEGFRKMVDALGLDSGGFGLRLFGELSRSAIWDRNFRYPPLGACRPFGRSDSPDHDGRWICAQWCRDRENTRAGLGPLSLQSAAITPFRGDTGRAHSRPTTTVCLRR